jgi:hypothetical protein
MQLEGGSVQLFKGGKSLPQILAEVYPEHNWEAFRFSRNSSSFWEELFQGTSSLLNLLIL